ncbi:MAG: DUF2752 domain-containing protein [Ilumatobacteraceae bacterium]
MQASCVVASPTRGSRLLPIAAWAGVAGAAVVVATHDPASPGNHFPGCIFHSATGLWCPGCGLTRGVHALLRLNIGASMSYNVFTPFVVIAILAALVSWTSSTLGMRCWRLQPAAQRRLVVWATVLLAVYGVLRNIPAAPFRALAP